MSELSARTYSCGGEGDLLRGGGEGSLGGCSETLEKNFRMPDFGLASSESLGGSSSTSDGTGDSDESDERSEESSSADILEIVVVVVLKLRCGGRGK